MRLDRHRLATMGVALCLLLLVVQPVAGVALATALILAPVFLFGLVETPQSLWPSADLERGLFAPVLARPPLFQRPPPASIL